MGSMRANRGPRLVRAAVAASLATFAALLSHIAGGGAVPGILGIVVPLLLSLAVCVVLAGRRLAPVRLAIAVALSQALFHTLFVLGAPATATATTAAPAHAHHHEVLALTPAGAGWEALAGGGAMWASHLLAAALTVALLLRGERTVLALLAAGRNVAAWARRVLARPLLAPRLIPGAPRAIASQVLQALSSRLFAADILRRGPPLLTVL